MYDTHLSARIPPTPAADRMRELQSSYLNKRPRNEYENDDRNEYENGDRVLLRRYSQHNHRWGGQHDQVPVSGYVNRRFEDFRPTERGSEGVGLRSLTDSSRNENTPLAPYNHMPRIPPSAHVLPEDASRTLFVQGVPSDCSRREVSHIFRHFLGYKEVRMVNKSREPRNEGGGEVVVLCFVDFKNPECAAAAMEALQGYRLDENERDSTFLNLKFAFPPRNRSSIALANRGRGRGEYYDYRRR